MKYLLLTALFTISLQAETIVSGIILQNAWWSKKMSPIIVTNDILIGPDARLVIEPGVEIIIEKPLTYPEGIIQTSKEDSLAVNITIKGALRCIGKPDNPIIFRGRYIDKSNQYSHWIGIRLNSSRSDEIFISYTRVYNAAIGIEVSQGSPLIRNSVFKTNNIGILANDKSSPRIVNALFTDNFLAAIRVNDANPEVYNSIFYKNHGIALWSDNKSAVTFSYNGLYNNEDGNFVQANPELGRLQKTNKNGDSTDTFGNIFLAPLFVGSPEEQLFITNKIKELQESSLTPPSQKEINKIKEKPQLAEDREYYLSNFSPYINAGSPKAIFREPNGSLPDLGIWGGPEFIQFK